jgi:hypothetical protein
VMGQREVKIRLAGQLSIFNVEAQAIREAIKITRRWRVNQRIIITDSLSNIVTLTFTRGNSKKMVLKDLMAEEGSNLKLMWVPAHVGIKGNEMADKAAKKALNQEVDNTYKVVKSDWSKWVKRKSWQVRQDERKSSGNLMAFHGDNKSWYRDYGWGTQTSHKHTD